MVLPKVLSEYLVDQIVWIVLVHFDFFENHATLFRNITGVERRVQYEIAQNVHGQRKMLVENFDVEADAFLRGESIHVAADRIDLTGDVFSGAGLGPLEHHVLYEVRDAIEFGILIAGTGLKPDADRDRADMRHLLGNDGKAIRQDLTTNAAGLFYH